MTDAPVQVEIDCLATARRILSGPTAVYSATPFEIVAMAACTVRESSGVAPELPVVADPPMPLPASLTARLAIAIQRWDELAKAESRFARAAVHSEPDFDAAARAHDQARDAFEDAFNILISRFEKEFPHGSA